MWHQTGRTYEGDRGDFKEDGCKCEKKNQKERGKVKDILKLQRGRRTGQARGSEDNHLMLMIRMMCLQHRNSLLINQSKFMESYCTCCWNWTPCPVSDGNGEVRPWCRERLPKLSRTILFLCPDARLSRRSNLSILGIAFLQWYPSTSGSENPRQWKHRNVAWQRQMGEVHLLDKKGATASHLTYLSGNMDFDSNWEAGIIRFLDRKIMKGQTAHDIYKIILKEEFAKIDVLMGPSQYLLACKQEHQTKVK